MPDNKIKLKKIYDDAILSGKISGAYAATRGAHKKIKSGNTFLGIAGSTSVMTGHYTRLTETTADEEIAKSVVYALHYSTVVYGRTGEKLLREKLALYGIDFSQEIYTKYIARQMIKDYNNDERREKFLASINALFSNDPNDIEANIAKAAIMHSIVFTTGDTSGADDIERRYKAGEIFGIAEVLDMVYEKHYDDAEDFTARVAFDIIFDFLLSNPDKIHKDFKNNFSNLTDEELVAYYIADCDGDGIKQYIKHLKKDGFITEEQERDVLFEETRIFYETALINGVRYLLEIRAYIYSEDAALYGQARVRVRYGALRSAGNLQKATLDKELDFSTELGDYKDGTNFINIVWLTAALHITPDEKQPEKIISYFELEADDLTKYIFTTDGEYKKEFGKKHMYEVVIGKSKENKAPLNVKIYKMEKNQNEIELAYVRDCTIEKTTALSFKKIKDWHHHTTWMLGMHQY